MRVPAQSQSDAEPQIIIRPLKSADAAAIAVLELACPDAAQWGIGGYGRLDSGEIGGLGAEHRNELHGFIVVRIVADEIEILNLAVSPSSRRQDIATKLLAAALAAGKHRGVSRAFLEARESNAAARWFYQSQGFRESGRRKGYYSQPYEDALVLTLSLT